MTLISISANPPLCGHEGKRPVTSQCAYEPAPSSKIVTSGDSDKIHLLLVRAVDISQISLRETKYGSKR